MPYTAYMESIKNDAPVYVVRAMETLCLSETERSDQSRNFGEEFMLLFFILLTDENRGPVKGLYQTPEIFLMRTGWNGFQHSSCPGIGFETSP